MTTETPIRNRELFRQIAEQIEAKPELYDQFAAWGVKEDCGTVCCIAGWGVILGAPSPYNVAYDGLGNLLGTRREILVDGNFLFTIDHAPIAAQKLLGLTEDEAETLFDGDWQPADGTTVPEALRAIADGAEIRSGWDGGDND